MPTTTPRSKTIKQLQLLADEKISVGIDMHKKTWYIAIWSLTRQEIIDKWVQPTDAKALFKRLNPLKAAISRIFYEAGPTGFTLARDLLSLEFPVKVISPAHTPESRRAAKCDRLDACRLAEYGAKGLLKSVYILTAEEERQRQISRLREQTTRKLRTTKLQIRSLLLFHGIAEPEKLENWSRRAIGELRNLELTGELRFTLHLLLDDLDHQVKQIKKIDEELNRLSLLEENAGPVGRVRSLPYFGKTTAMVIVTEMPAPERFEEARHVTSFQGLAPGIASSGETVKEGPLADGGNRRLRTALVEAAWRWVTHDPGAALLFKRLLSKLGKKQKAIVAVARRLGIIVWKLMTGTENYDPSRLAQKG